MTSDISDKQLLNKLCFVKWKNAIQAINDYTNKRLDELNEIIEKYKDRCRNEIIPQIVEFRPRVGLELSLEDFERYVGLHKQLYNTMLDIKSTCLKVHDEINATVTDSMKLIDQRSPLYSKFMMPSKVEEEEKSSVFIMFLVTLLFLGSIVVTSYLIMEDDELNTIIKSLKIYKKFT